MGSVGLYIKMIKEESYLKFVFLFVYWAIPRFICLLRENHIFILSSTLKKWLLPRLWMTNLVGYLHWGTRIASSYSMLGFIWLAHTSWEQLQFSEGVHLWATVWGSPKRQTIDNHFHLGIFYWLWTRAFSVLLLWTTQSSF